MRGTTYRRRIAVAAVTTALLTGTLHSVSAQAAPAGPRADRPAACTAPTGPYQRQLERYLQLPVDGRQSTEDCEAVRDFQRQNGIRPADGQATLGTYRISVVLTARKNPNAAGKCPVRSYRVTCVDMDRQVLWVQKGERVLVPPVPIRTGREAEETRRGMHTISWRSRDHHSTLYDNAPMPYAQFFDGGQALHGHPGDLYDGGGSAGCVNLRMPDAKRLWDLLDEGDHVYVWGTKPGTGA
ncbi:L,D-transpeptidase family protein [Streptomyces sp. HNM0574]|uniref:L,D-transpeptidase family protein n=1 Tax=Streptomyces sp. HNM0574 TaxID=2714954 RepID=UPI00146B91E1|nr:L,D-transpeptidase family protein [Streptomyces sp. HNM0574]NLU69369.1 murein L,D-transpeptidase [Streptomyces sp. HNM0574]